MEIETKPRRNLLVGQKLAIEIWVIYDHPLDYPHHFVVRRWLNDVPDRECGLFDSLREARLHVPRGLARLPRWENDDPKIVEVWL
jgi:hypothetical protein